MEKELSQDNIINRIAKEILKQYEKDKQDKYKKQILHNTKLLMKNYIALKDHVESVNDDIEDLEFKVGLEDREVLILSVARSKIRTIKMLAYIDSALDILERKFWEKGESHKFRAFEMYYLDGCSNEEICKTLGCGINSPKRWSDTVMKELGPHIWGVESLDIVN